MWRSIAGHDDELVVQVPSHRPLLLLAYEGIQAFDAGEGKWKTIAKLALRQLGATATMLDETMVLVAGGPDEEHSIVEVCTIRWQ